MINIYLSYIKCDEETNEVGNDEPYVLVVAVALTPSVAGVPIQAPVASDVIVYPFRNRRTGGRAAFGVFESFWGIGGASSSLANPDDAIFIVAMMENDDGDPQLTRGVVDTAVNVSLVESLALPRAAKVTTLVRDVDSARRAPTGIPSFDEAIGVPQELRFSLQELQRAESGQTVTKTMVFEGDGGRYTLMFDARNKAVAAKPQDKWVLVSGNRIMVITNSGEVHVHQITDDTVGASSQLGGPAVAANPQDRRVLVMGNRILVNTNDGGVFAHDITGEAVGIPFQLDGPPLAANPQDKWVLVMGSRIMVITNNGGVFVHEITRTTIGNPFQLGGPLVAANPQDKWVLVMGSRIMVVTNNGGVFVHEIASSTVGSPFQLDGPPVAVNPQDKWVFTMGNRLIVITSDGRVFVHDVTANTIGAPRELS